MSNYAFNTALNKGYNKSWHRTLIPAFLYLQKNFSSVDSDVSFKLSSTSWFECTLINVMSAARVIKATVPLMWIVTCSLTASIRQVNVNNIYQCSRHK